MKITYLFVLKYYALKKIIITNKFILVAWCSIN